MKALSIRQPWIHAIVHLGKRVENRDWTGCSYRGPILLHASKTLMLRDFDDDVEQIRSVLTTQKGRPVGPLIQEPPADLAVWSDKTGWRPAPTLPFGGIVGRARIVAASRHDLRPSVLSSLWYAGGFALVLDDVEPMPFIPWKGSLGFFDVPDEVLAGALRDQRPVPCGHVGSCDCPTLADL